MTAARRWGVIALPDSDRHMVVSGVDQLALTHPLDAAKLVEEHNELVDELAQRPTIGNIEAMLTRIVAAAMREIARDLLPRWLAKRVSTAGDKPVHLGDQ